MIGNTPCSRNHTYTPPSTSTLYLALIRCVLHIFLTTCYRPYDKLLCEEQQCIKHKTIIDKLQYTYASLQIHNYSLVHTYIVIYAHHSIVVHTYNTLVHTCIIIHRMATSTDITTFLGTSMGFILHDIATICSNYRSNRDIHRFRCLTTIRTGYSRSLTKRYTYFSSTSRTSMIFSCRLQYTHGYYMHGYTHCCIHCGDK